MRGTNEGKTAQAASEPFTAAPARSLVRGNVALTIMSFPHPAFVCSPILPGWRARRTMINHAFSIWCRTLIVRSVPIFPDPAFVALIFPVISRYFGS